MHKKKSKNICITRESTLIHIHKIMLCKFFWTSSKNHENNEMFLKIKKKSISWISFSQEYSVQITFREDWNDPRLIYDDFEGKLKYLTMTEADRVWMPDTFFQVLIQKILFFKVIFTVHKLGVQVWNMKMVFYISTLGVGSSNKH